MKLSLITLGCPKNTVDSEMIRGSLNEPFVQFVEPDEEPEVIIINTCGFIQSAKEEAIDTIFEAVQLKTEGRCRKVVVTGCLVNRYQDELIQEIPEVDAFVDHRDLPKMVQNLKAILGIENQDFYDRKLLTLPHYAYLKIAEGCSNNCTYCAIPIIRGPLRSRLPDEIIAEANKLVKTGVRELIVIAQDITNYGKDLDNSVGLTKLIEPIINIPDLQWIRLMYAHPAHFTDDVIDLIAESGKICKYVDLPIQHISNGILKRMNRKVTRAQIENLIQKLRDKIPDIAIRTSLILGFPGESEDEFQELMDFVRDIRFDRLGAFSYSKEEGTVAYNYNETVAPDVISERIGEIMEIQAQISFERNENLVGRTLDVIVDEYDVEAKKYLGRTQWDAPEIDNIVWIERNPEITPGQLCQVRVDSVFEFDLNAQYMK